ncbi:MAG: TRAP transporter small permease [Christensenella sp.]
MRKAVNKLMNFLSGLIGVLLFAAVVLVLIQVFWRYVLRSPLGWTDQLCRFLYVWIIMLGLPVLFHSKAATAFDFFSGKLGEKQKSILQIFICLLGMFFAVCFFLFSWAFMMKKGSMVIPAFKVIPYYAVYASIPIAGVLVFIEMLLQLTESVKELVKETR